MAREVVIHTWCDVEFNEQEDAARRVDARTITWFLDGQRMEVDLCLTHETNTSVSSMDTVVRTYGRPWEDPSAPLKPKSKKKSQRMVPEDVPIEHGHYDGERQTFYCTYPGCVKTKNEGMARLQSFRMHQRQAHGVGVPDKKEK